MYLFVAINLFLVTLLVRSVISRRKQAKEDEYTHAVKSIFRNNPDIRDKMKDKFKF